MSENTQFLVGIGASAGGLVVLKELVKNIPKDSGLAYIIIQHLDPTHESMLSELLAKQTSLRVCEAKDGMAIEPNNVYVIPPDKYLTVSDDHIVLSPPKHERGMRKAIDHLFRSMADAYGPYCAGLVLSGAGSDGTSGLRAIKAAGGLVLAQNPESAEHESMPQSAIDAGFVDNVLEASEMAEAIVQYVEYIREHPNAFSNSEVNTSQIVPDNLHELAALLETYESFNLHQYKHGTVSRRIIRRLNLTGTQNYKTYLELLRTNEQERKQLTKDLLINVTDFFRDPEAFEHLEKDVIAPLFKEIKSDKDIRVWVAGCATGEEAYSIAILLHEHLHKARKRNVIKIFATDIDEDAIKAARSGMYPLSIVGEVPQSYLMKYFNKVNSEYYQIKQHIRDVISFATQNLSSDPPFSKMDIISCRNLLIYLRREVQQKAMRSFYFALNDNGHLFLGSSETLGEQSEMFKTLSKKWRIFKKIPGVSQRHELFKHLTSVTKTPARKKKKASERPPSRAERLQQLILQTVVPACVIINDEGNIIYRYGNLNPYLIIPSGEPRHDLVQMIPASMRSRVRSSIFKAKKEKAILQFTAPLDSLPESSACKVSIFPATNDVIAQEDAMVLTFETVVSETTCSNESESKEETDYVQKLELELSEVKEELQNTIEELETSSEELKASHEETLSSNEELQSSNEELEASSEELRSLNEELSTVNSQLKEKVEALQRANNDVENLVASTDIATVFLDSHLKIQRYTPAAEKLLKMGPRDLDRPITSLGRELVDDTLTEDARSVLDNFKTIRKEVQDYRGYWFIRQLTPYRTEDRRIKGVVITFQDIHELKCLKERAENREKQQQTVAKLGMRALDDVPMDEIMHQAVRHIAHVMDVDYCKILEYRREKNDLLLVAGTGWQEGLIGKAIVENDRNSQAGYTLSVSEPVIVDDLETEKRFTAPPLLRDHHVTSGISCLINHRILPYGILSIHSKKKRIFNEDDTNFMVSMANLISNVVRHKEFQLQLEDAEKCFRIAQDAANLGMYDWNIEKDVIKWDERIREI